MRPHVMVVYIMVSSLALDLALGWPLVLALSASAYLYTNMPALTLAPDPQTTVVKFKRMYMVPTLFAHHRALFLLRSRTKAAVSQWPRRN